MESKAMKILIIEDDIDDCNRFVNCIKERKDIELVGITDSDTEGLKYVKLKHPEGIVLDLELNNSTSGNTDSLEFLLNLKNIEFPSYAWIFSTAISFLFCEFSRASTDILLLPIFIILLAL